MHLVDMFSFIFAGFRHLPGNLWACSQKVSDVGYCRKNDGKNIHMAGGGVLMFILYIGCFLSVGGFLMHYG
ncbi:hypothetical protein DT73_14105 [Mangrovibacter sp. MFB070]|nr:hypothetical protein DT73_14105 [Mangrovibacter sp. MFB070]